jgi:hypothetical protein
MEALDKLAQLFCILGVAALLLTALAIAFIWLVAEADRHRFRNWDRHRERRSWLRRAREERRQAAGTPP